MIGGNQTQLKRQNLRQVLQSFYRLETTTRVALAAATGLTKPTISSLVNELIDEGLISEDGYGTSTDQGGKRPALLHFMPAARQVIGVAVERGSVVGVLCDLFGKPSARHEMRLDPGNVGASLKAVAAALRPQLDAPLLGIAFALPGRVDTAAGKVSKSASLNLEDVHLAGELEHGHGVPVWLANYAELSALGQLAFGFDPADRPLSLVTVALEGQVELGVSLRHGADHHGSELAAPLLDAAGLSAQALEELLPTDEPDCCLRLRYLAGTGDPAALARLLDLADRLGHLCAWATLVLRPERLTLSGRLAELGDGFTEMLRESMSSKLGRFDLPVVGVAHADHLAALGAAALVLQKELGLLS